MSISTRTTASGVRRYEVRLRDTSGREYSRTFRTRKEAEQFQATEKADRARGNWIDPRRTATKFRDVAAEWQECNPAKKPSTIARDANMLRLHILPAIGDLPIGSISPVDVQRMVNSWVDKHRPRTVLRQYSVARAVFSYAVDTDRIGRSPCRRIKLPAIVPTRTLLASPDQLRALAGELPETGAPMVYLGAVLGLRWGEAAGLRVGDIDFLTRTVTVATQLTRGPGGRMIAGDPKWNSGRTMAAPTELLELLAEHLRRRQLTAADKDKTVCANSDGTSLDYTNWRQRHWIPACKRAGVPGLKFQSLRTLNTTAMVALAVDVKTAQTRAGHKNAQTTLNIYAKPTAVADHNAAQLLGAYFLQPGEVPEQPANSRDDRGTHEVSTAFRGPADPPDQDFCGGATWNRTRDLSIISAAL